MIKLEDYNKFIIAIRDTCILLIFILLLFVPKFINDRLKEAGITSFSALGIEWQNQIDKAIKESESVANSVIQSQNTYDSLIAQLENLNRQATEPAIKLSLTRISQQANNSRQNLVEANKSLRNSILIQQKIMSQIKSYSAPPSP